MTDYSRNPAEVVRVKNLIAAGLSQSEAARFFRGGDAWRFARAIGMRVGGRTERVMISAIYRHLADAVTPVVPEPEPTPEPKPEPAPEPESHIPTCTAANCGGLANAKGLRWDKINKGIPITWSVDRTNEPNTFAFTDAEIQGWFDAWTVHGGVRATKVEGIGDCHIKFAPIDGPGQTLGFVMQPRLPAEEMAAAGTISGDMTIDSSERSWPLVMTRLVGKHEVGHVFGLAHSEILSDLMYFQLNKSRDVGPQSGDVREYKKRYPKVITV